MLKGTTIKYIPQEKQGNDGFNKPMYAYPEEKAEFVENILIAPTSSSDVLSATDLTGKRAIYTLAIPKEDTHDWERCIVEFFGQRWKPFGISLEGIPENIPLGWNKKVTVERYE